MSRTRYEELEPKSYVEIVGDFIAGLVRKYPFIVGFIMGAIFSEFLLYFVVGVVFIMLIIQFVL